MIGPIIRSLARRHMDVTLKQPGGLRVRIMERPGLWMDDDTLAAMTEDLRKVARRTLTGELAYGVFSGERDRLEQTIITLVRRKDGTPVAFNALAVMRIETDPRPVDVLHLGLVMVDPGERSKSLSWVLYGLTCFLILMRHQFRPVWISNVTQVPAVVGMVAEMFSDVWPGPGAGRRTLRHLLLARRIMARHRHVFGVGDEAGFDEARFVITNAYTGGSDDLKKTFDEAPKHRNAIYNDFCAQELDYARGDDVIQLGRMDIPAIRRYLGREVPKSAVLGVIATGVIVALQRLVLPVLHWSDSTRSMGILRPAREGR